MSRVGKKPVAIPQGVSVTVTADHISVKGSLGTLERQINSLVSIKSEGGVLSVVPNDASTAAGAMSGTVRALVANMVNGVSKGFERKLELVGVGYRAKALGKTVNMVLGFSHPIDYVLPEGVTAETPTQTEILLKSADRQLLGQVAAELRQFREPEPYKGKGVRYGGEQVYRKEAKKK